MSWKIALALGAGLTVTACAPQDGATSAETLNELVVTDPNFTFATSKNVRIELQPSAAEPGGHAVEVTDQEGRRLLKGAVLGDAVVEMPLPAAQATELRVRTGRNAVEQTVAIDADDRASARF